MTIRDAIAEVVSDGRVTGDEWAEKLEPALDGLPARAGDEARGLLELWASDSLQIDDFDRMKMASALGRFGYEVPRRPAGVPARELIDYVKGTNVTERDPELDRLSAATGRTSNELTVGVIDSGFSIDHAAFKDKLWANPGEIPGDGLDNDGNGLADDVHGWDFHDGNAGLHGALPHGTHVLGIATRGTDRINGVACRVHDLDGMKGQDVADAIDYEVKNGARVVNMSFKVDVPDALNPVLAAIKRHPEVLFVKSAGNDGANDPNGALPGGRGDLHLYDPGWYLGRQKLPNLAVISGADPDGTISTKSNYGAPYSTHAAPERVNSAIDGDRYLPRSATSMAAPNYSAAAGKLLLLDDALTPEQLNAVLARTSDKSEQWTDLTAAGGVINGDQAMRVAALTGLMRRGTSADAAADQIGLAGEEREELTSLARELLAPRSSRA